VGRKTDRSDYNADERAEPADRGVSGHSNKDASCVEW
jgi:hypothetical protein